MLFALLFAHNTFASSSCCYYQCGNNFFFLFASSFCVPFSFIHSIRSFVRLSHLSSFSFATFRIRLSNSPDILMHRYKQKSPHSTQIQTHRAVAYRAVPSFTSKTPKIYIRWILCFVDCCSLGFKILFSPLLLLITLRIRSQTLRWNMEYNRSWERTLYSSIL